MHDTLSTLGNALGLGVLPELDPVQTLYANLMGSVVVVWAVLRIVRPLSVHGLLDGIARTLFAAWQAYALAHGAMAAAVAVLHHRGGVRRPACAVVAELAHELVGSRSRPDRWAPARHSESVKPGLGHTHRHPSLMLLLDDCTDGLPINRLVAET